VTQQVNLWQPLAGAPESPLSARLVLQAFGLVALALLVIWGFARQRARSETARLATLGTQSAATLRELAEHHERLAVGTASTVPAAAARFEDGEGAPAPTDQELRALAGRARTPADHRALAEYFMTVAEGHTMEAEHHTAMAQAYRGNANRRGGDPAVHCDRLVKLAREAAKEALAAETVHTQLATIG